MIRKALLIVCCVLLVVTATMAVSSYWWAGTVYYTTTKSVAWFSWNSGSVEAVYVPVPVPGWVGWKLSWRRPTSTSTATDIVRWWRSMHFSYVRTPRGAVLKVPAWVPVMVFALPTWLLARPLLRARRRRRRGLCVGCGYDLTGNTSGRCPECGEAI